MLSGAVVEAKTQPNGLRSIYLDLIVMSSTLVSGCGIGSDA